jgi:hypothetical protein
MVLWGPGGSGGVRAQLEGNLVADGTFTGTLEDPAPGVYDPVFSSGCTFEVTGTVEWDE